MIDLNDRNALWQRLLDNRYFDAHNRKQLQAEQKFFLIGEITYAEEKYLGQAVSLINPHNELFMHPVQNAERWREWQVRWDFEKGGSLEKDVSLSLIGRDFQYYGFSPEAQLELHRFLDLGEVYRLECPFSLYTALETWLRNVYYWLRAEDDPAEGATYLAYKFGNSKYALLKSYLYSMLEYVPGDMFLPKVLKATDTVGSEIWESRKKEYLQLWLKDLLRLLARYRLPAALACDPQARLDFVEAMKADLTGGAAPEPLQTLWMTMKR